MSKGADGRRPSRLTCEPPPAQEQRREPSPASSMTGCLVRPARCRVAVTGPSAGRCVTCRGRPGTVFDRRARRGPLWSVTSTRTMPLSDVMPTVIVSLDAHRGMHARLSGADRAGARRWRGPSVAVRKKADGVHRPCWGTDAVRYASVDTATQRPAALQGDTPRDRAETARIAENSQLAGRFRRWWQVLGSNQRRLSRRFYRPFLPDHRNGR
jgi:hypothetical protein